VSRRFPISLRRVVCCSAFSTLTLFLPFLRFSVSGSAITLDTRRTLEETPTTTLTSSKLSIRPPDDELVLRFLSFRYSLSTLPSIYDFLLLPSLSRRNLILPLFLLFVLGIPSLYPFSRPASRPVLVSRFSIPCLSLSRVSSLLVYFLAFSPSLSRPPSLSLFFWGLCLTLLLVSVRFVFRSKRASLVALPFHFFLLYCPILCDLLYKTTCLLNFSLVAPKVRYKERKGNESKGGRREETVSGGRTRRRKRAPPFSPKRPAAKNQRQLPCSLLSLLYTQLSATPRFG